MRRAAGLAGAAMAVVWAGFLGCGGATSGVIGGGDAGNSGSGSGTTSGSGSGSGSSSGGGSTSSGSGSGSSSGVSASGSGSGSSSTSSGSSSSSGSGSASGSSSGGSSSSSGGGGGPCPPTAPHTGDPCSQEGLECEYGTNVDPTCNTIATCMNGSWSVPGPPPGPLGCDPSQPIVCPGTFASVPRGMACSPNDAYCDYPQGRCSCTDDLGLPMPNPTWACQDPSDPSCPTPRPYLGTPCTQEGLFCDYGSCSVLGGTAEQCTGGVWTSAAFACAMAGGSPGGGQHP